MQVLVTSPLYSSSRSVLLSLLILLCLLFQSVTSSTSQTLSLTSSLRNIYVDTSDKLIVIIRLSSSAMAPTTESAINLKLSYIDSLGINQELTYNSASDCTGLLEQKSCDCIFSYPWYSLNSGKRDLSATYQLTYDRYLDNMFQSTDIINFGITYTVPDSIQLEGDGYTSSVVLTEKDYSTLKEGFYVSSDTVYMTNALDTNNPNAIPSNFRFSFVAGYFCCAEGVQSITNCQSQASKIQLLPGVIEKLVITPASDAPNNKEYNIEFPLSSVKSQISSSLTTCAITLISEFQCTGTCSRSIIGSSDQVTGTGMFKVSREDSNQRSKAFIASITICAIVLVMACIVAIILALVFFGVVTIPYTSRKRIVTDTEVTTASTSTYDDKRTSNDTSSTISNM
jgi:hypothetical protein